MEYGAEATSRLFTPNRLGSAPSKVVFRAAIADDRVPVTVRFFLILRRDLEGKSLGVPEHRAAVKTETGNAQDGELHRQHIALLAARIVTGSLVNSGYVCPAAVAQEVADQGPARIGDLSGGSPRELIDLPVHRNGIMYNPV